MSRGTRRAQAFPRPLASAPSTSLTMARVSLVSLFESLPGSPVPSQSLPAPRLPRLRLPVSSGCRYYQRTCRRLAEAPLPPRRPSPSLACSQWGCSLPDEPGSRFRVGCGLFREQRTRRRLRPRLLSAWSTVRQPRGGGGELQRGAPRCPVAPTTTRSPSASRQAINQQV